MSKGAYRIGTTDSSGSMLDEPARYDPSDERAVDIFIGLVKDAPNPVPADQSALLGKITEALRVVQELYGEGGLSFRSDRARMFRIFYTRIFRLAQLGLEGDRAEPAIAEAALLAVQADLIDEEAARVKNGHLLKLAKFAALLGSGCLLLYFILRAMPVGSLEKFDINTEVMASFMVLWVGCFVGVCLSYAIRKTSFTLTDLTIPEGDRLLPGVRLVFAGTLTMILGVIFTLGIISVKIGPFAVTDFADKPMLAFLLGALCGVSELLLPSIVGKISEQFAGSLKK